MILMMNEIKLKKLIESELNQKLRKIYKLNNFFSNSLNNESELKMRYNRQENDSHMQKTSLVFFFKIFQHKKKHNFKIKINLKILETLL